MDISINSERLLLRNFITEDKEEFHKILQDPEIYKTLPEDHMYNENEVSQMLDWFIETYGINRKGNVVKIPLAIILKSTNQLIGDIGIGQFSFDESKTEIFYFINSKYWGNGYVSEAMKVFMEYIYKLKIADYLVASVVPINTASQRILLKNGFSEIENTYNNHDKIYELRLT
jgi:ribosomal-protein-alanine N-acetyltransferase